MREISVETIIEHIKEMCMEANFVLSDDIKEALDEYKEQEVSETGKNILFDIIKNAEIAETDRVPMCQDTGMAVVFVELGQEVN